MSTIILDRDGVINYDSEFYIKSPDEWHAIPGSLDAIAKLNRAGYQVLILTNQSGVARGFYDLETLHNIHKKLMQQLEAVGGQVKEIFFCPHHPEDRCECRKPKPGLFFEIQKKYGINLKDTYFVGDSLTDIHAAQAAGCTPLLVLTGNGKKTLEKNPDMRAIHHFENLAEAVEFVLENKN